MKAMFSGHLLLADISNQDVSNVENMSHLFAGFLF